VFKPLYAVAKVEWPAALRDVVGCGEFLRPVVVMGPMSAFKSVVIGPLLPVIIVWLCIVSFKMLWVSKVGSAVAGCFTSLLFPQDPRNALECLRVC
jgi:hypothetical protein